MIENFGKGVDNIDVDEEERRGIKVKNKKNVMKEENEEMKMEMILQVKRRIVEGENVINERNGKWKGWQKKWMIGRRIWGKSIGIVGMGRIGKEVERREKEFGIQINYKNRKRVRKKVEEEMEEKYWERIEKMMERMEIIQVN